MKGQLQNKIALVTGGGSGIGKSTALAFAKEGAKVVVADVIAEGAQQTVKEIRESGGEAIFVKVDVSKSSEVQAMIEKTLETYGRLDCAYNNAGVAITPMLIPDTNEEDWDRVININLKGVWLCMKYEIPQMLKQGKGAIVNASSMVGLIGLEKRSAYAASKHGVLGLTKVAALEYADSGIRVNAVCPAPIRTPLVEKIIAADPEAEKQLISMIPMKRLGTLEEVAQVVVWLCSDASSFVTGQAIGVDGGVLAR
ncbi:MAG: short chain dehydrogenase [Aquificota bacterium]|nr:MAG: short chain dehydrogenase [Aquificota bacterium]HDG98076.1 SDR family oxidoreductase [Desulfobacterales bacterium]